MSRRSIERSRSGLSLIECVVATLVLSLVAVGLARASVATERLVSSMETWCVTSPSYFLVPRAERFERLLGCAADLSSDNARSAPRTPGSANVVTLLHVTRDVVARSASTTVLVEAVNP